MIVVDTSVLIAHLNADDSCHSRAEAMLLQTAGHPLATSSITLAEILVGPARAGKPAVARAALGTLDVEEVPIRAGAAERLAGLRADTGLKLPDCCVLIAAQEVHADAVLTFDDQLSKRAQRTNSATDGT